MIRLFAAMVLLAPGIARADGAAARAKALEAVVNAGFSRADALDRVQEWDAKGASAARVLALLEALRKAALDGRAALEQAGVTASPSAVEAAAGARLAGVGLADLASTLRGARSPDDAEGRCLALSTLALSGFAPKAAAGLVALAAERGYRRADLGEMVSAVQRLSREGVAPRGALLGELGTAVRRGARPRELYPAVLRALGGPRAAPEGGYVPGGHGR